MILALVNNKGGVGKTTTAVNLAAGLASNGSRVLLVDLDGQGSASFSVGIKRAELTPSSADVIIDGRDIAKTIRETAVAGLDILTGSMELAGAEEKLARARSGHVRLKKMLDRVRDDYAFIVIDCPPSLSILQVNALVAADAYIVPVMAHYLSLEGLVNLLDTIENIRVNLGAQVRLLGLLLTMVDYRAKATKENIKIIRGYYRDLVFTTEVRVNTKLAEAPAHGVPVFEYAPDSTGAAAYRELVKEVLHRSNENVSFRMNILGKCPNTGIAYRFADALSGRLWKCPCGKVHRVPIVVGRPPAPLPERAPARQEMSVPIGSSEGESDEDGPTPVTQVTERDYRGRSKRILWGAILLIIALGLLFDFLKMGGGLGGEEAGPASLLAVAMLIVRFGALGVCSGLSVGMLWRGVRGRQRIAESDLDDSRTQ